MVEQVKLCKKSQAAKTLLPQHWEPLVQYAWLIPREDKDVIEKIIKSVRAVKGGHAKVAAAKAHGKASSSKDDNMKASMAMFGLS